MKKVSDFKKIFYSITILIIIAGIIVIATKGFKFSLRYDNNTRIELNLGKAFEINDIKQITNEVFEGQEVILQKVEIFEDTVSVTTKEVTDEQKQKFVDKINEKYGLERKVENLNIIQQPHTRGRDICKQYITPTLIAFILIVIYISIRYRKINSFKTLTDFIKFELIFIALYFSIIAILRLPIDILTMPIAVLVAILVLIIFILNSENKLEKVQETSEGKK